MEIFLGVTESLHSRVSSNDLIFEGAATFELWSIITSVTNVLAFATEGGNNSEVLDDTLINCSNIVRNDASPF